MQPSISHNTAPQQAMVYTTALALTPSEQELQLLNYYVLGHISLQEANEVLQGQGRIMVALYKHQLVEA